MLRKGRGVLLKVEKLYYLYMVYRYESVKLAAEEIHVVPAAVSSAIHKLEKEIGLELMTRTYRGVELTEDGVEIAKLSESIFHRMDIIESYIAEKKKAENAALQVIDESPLKIYVTSGYYDRIGDIIGYFENLGLTSTVSRVIKDSEKNIEAVNEDTNAIAFVFLKEPLQEIEEKYPNVNIVKLKSSRPYIICHESYFPANVKEITPQEAIKLPLLLYTDGYDQVLPIYEMLESYGALNIIQQYPSMSVIYQLLTEKKGCSAATNIFFDFRTMQFLPSGLENHLRSIPIKSDMRISFCICYHKDISELKENVVTRIIHNIS